MNFDDQIRRYFGTEKLAEVAPAAFEATKASPNAHPVMGPWHHGQANATASTLGALEWGSDTGKWFRQNVMLPFLDQHLKGGPTADIARVTADCSSTAVAMVAATMLRPTIVAWIEPTAATAFPVAVWVPVIWTAICSVAFAV